MRIDYCTLKCFPFVAINLKHSSRDPLSSCCVFTYKIEDGPILHSLHVMVHNKLPLLFKVRHWVVHV